MCVHSETLQELSGQFVIAWPVYSLWLFTQPRVTYHEGEELTQNICQHVFRCVRGIQVLAASLWFGCPWELKGMLVTYLLVVGGWGIVPKLGVYVCAHVFCSGVEIFKLHVFPGLFCRGRSTSIT